MSFLVESVDSKMQVALAGAEGAAQEQPSELTCSEVQVGGGGGAGAGGRFGGLRQQEV